jgi:hypothetical protein
MSQGIGVNGVTANITYGALLQGNVTAKALLKNYVAQFERAGWHTVASSFGENAGFASVSRTIEGSTWNALLTLYQADRPHAYFAQLSASGKPVRQQVASNERLPALPQSLPKSQTPLFLELVKRILNGNEPGQTALIIGKLPSDLPSAVPLPEGRVLGSTITVANLQGGNDTATLYLDMTGAQLQAYENVLAREGWLGQSLGRRTIGGFQSAPGSEPVIYCKESQPPITIVAHPGENAVAVTVDRSSVADACRPFPAPPASFGYNLPNIVAPSRSIHRWTSGESTGVSFETSLTPAAVLDSFAKQMASQGWTPSAAISNETAATQTFTRTDPKNGTHRAVLTIYRSGPKPDVYSAILDVT